MISTILLVINQPSLGERSMISIGGLLALLAYFLLFGLIVIGLIRLVKFFGTGGKEMKLMRMEVGKLADEVQLLRKELKDSKEDNSST